MGKKGIEKEKQELKRVSLALGMTGKTVVPPSAYQRGVERYGKEFMKEMFVKSEMMPKIQ